jgi:flagellar basal-body rod modification protein FlgD
MPDMISNNIGINTPPEVKIESNKTASKIPSNIKIYDKKGHVLGKDDFLKLFVTQLSKQDPTNPVNDREFISQMAQFSSLEQMNNVANNMSELKTIQANSLIGKLITGKDSLNGNTVTGKVTRIIFDGSGNIFLRTKDHTIQTKDLISVEEIVEVNPNENVSRETINKSETESLKEQAIINKNFEKGQLAISKIANYEYENNNK